MTTDDNINFYTPEDQPSLEREADLTVPEPAPEQPTTRPPVRRPKQTKPAGSDPYTPFSW